MKTNWYSGCSFLWKWSHLYGSRHCSLQICFPEVFDGESQRGRKCGSAAPVLTMALLRPPAQAQPVMKHHGDVIDLEVNSPQVSLGDNGQRAVLLQVEWHGISAQRSSSRIDRFSNSLQIPIKLGGQGELCPTEGPFMLGGIGDPAKLTWINLKE